MSEAANKSITKANKSTQQSSRGCPKTASVVKRNQKEVPITMLDLALKMYKDAVGALTNNNKNVPPSTFRTISEAFGNPPWMNCDAIY
jgi:hypothetical protein